MPTVTMNYEKIEWTYIELTGENKDDTFNFKQQTNDSTEDGDTDQVLFELAFSGDEKSDNNDIAMEELTIAHEYIERHESADAPTFDDLFA